ncbi:MAG: hypothetical protein GYA15_00965 [Leptolinea sp.]|nr:hypothetical protein [Leptolinea sp.]
MTISSKSWIAEAYIKKIRPVANRELEWFKNQKNLDDAIHYAALALNCCEKRYSHQRRITRENLHLSKKILLQNIEGIKNCPSFDALYTLLESLLEPVSGLGELYIYDTAFRLGAYLRRMPERVYLHAGTRVGAKNLGFDRKKKTLEVAQMPEWLQQLQPYEIEDVLCIFKDKLSKNQIDFSEEEMLKRSRCS